jgi:hypothetical protein
MDRINQRVDSLAALSDVLQDVHDQLQYHTESGFTEEEANSYGQQIHDLQKVLIPEWEKRLKADSYTIDVQCVPALGGFLKIRIQRHGAEPVEVFAESYARFNSDMFDGSCYQYVYQKVLCYQEGLDSGRVPL